MVTRERPSVEVERSSSMPATVLTAASMRSVISVSMFSGVAPGFEVVTETTGVSTRGIAIDAEREERDAADHGDGGNQHRREDGTADADLGKLLHDVGPFVTARRLRSRRRPRRAPPGWTSRRDRCR